MFGGRSARALLALCALTATLELSAVARAQEGDAHLHRSDDARPPTDDTLEAARQTFAQAVADEDAGRHEAALAEFRQVATVRDTPNVRYRIATCLEALGQRAAALEAYSAAIQTGTGDPSAADTVQAARARAALLEHVVAHVTLSFSRPPPAGVEVRVDDAVVRVEGLGALVVLDPGHHSIGASAPGAVPFRTTLTLAEGGRITVGIDLAPPPEAARAATGPLAPIPEERRAPDLTPSWVAFGVSGLLAIGAGVAFGLRGSNLATLDRDCQRQAGALLCPPSLSSEVSGARSAAVTEGPLGIAAAVGAGVALATGVGLYLGSEGRGRPSGETHARLWMAPIYDPNHTGGGVALGGAF